MDAQQAISIMVERLRQAFHPRRIVLFGSHARGTARPGSDIDLLVVLDQVQDTRAAMASAMRLFPDLTVPKDILVTDIERLRRRASWPHTIEAVALAEGRELYAA
jgi:predicted nucleotidyltransferase